MRKMLGLVVVLGLAATPALAQKVTIDYAESFDFATVKTFQYVETRESNSADPLMHDRIIERLKGALIADGLTEATSDPDLFVTYHVTTEPYTVYQTTSFGYGGYGYGWHRWGTDVGSSTTTATTYTEGSLIIDAYEPGEKNMIWRGTGTVTVKAKPEKRIQQVEKILTKLGHRWKKILAKQGR